MKTDKVIDFLVSNGYRKVAQPLHVADLDFDFAGTLTGPDEQESLTVVLDGERSALLAAERRLRAFAVVLERTGSTRPITVVVVAGDPDSRAITALEQLGRVVVVESGAELSGSLHSLLRLTLPLPITSSLSAEQVLKEELGGTTDPVITQLLKAAKDSAEKVRLTMQQIVTDKAETES